MFAASIHIGILDFGVFAAMLRLRHGLAAPE